VQDDFEYTAVLDGKIRTMLANHKRWFPEQVSMPWYSFAHGDSANVYQVAALPTMMCEASRKFKLKPNRWGLDTFFDENSMAAENQNYGRFSDMIATAHEASTLWSQPIVLCRGGTFVMQRSPFDRSDPGPPRSAAQPNDHDRPNSADDHDHPNSADVTPSPPCLKSLDGVCIDFTKRDEAMVARVVGDGSVRWKWNGTFTITLLPDGRLTTPPREGPLNCWGHTEYLTQSCWWSATSTSVFVYFGATQNNIDVHPEELDLFEMKPMVLSPTNQQTTTQALLNATSSAGYGGPAERLEGVRVGTTDSSASASVAMERVQQ